MEIWIPGDPATATQQERKISWRQKRTYLSNNARKAKEALTIALLPDVPAVPFDQPIRLEITFYFKRPKSVHTNKAYKYTKPDLDNLIKGICDVMQKCGYYVNDSRIACMTVAKLWTDTQSGIHISLIPLDE